MPRKPRITAVPVEQPEGLITATELLEEKTDAEQMTEILQEVKEEPKAEIEQVLFEVPLIAPVLPVVEKLKAKRASRAKPKEEPIKEAVKEEPKEELKEEPKGEDKVGCPDCGKQMSAKTLKYSHGPNCSSKKPHTNTDKKEEQRPVFTQGSQDQRAIQREEITEELIEHHIRTRSRAARALRRETMLNNLVQSAF